MVCSNYGLIEEIESEIKVEETILEENDIVVWEEIIEGDENYETEQVEALEECILDAQDFEKEKPQIIHLPDPPRAQKRARAQAPPLDPADDDKIRQIANMNCELCNKLLIR